MELNLQSAIHLCFSTQVSSIANVTTSRCAVFTNSDVIVYDTIKAPVFDYIKANDITYSSFPFVSDVHSNETFYEWWKLLSAKYLIHSMRWTVALLLLYLLILIVGLLGNTLVILAYIYRPQMRSVINFFIMNLAVADLVAILFCCLGNFLTNTIRPWILGEFMCKVMAYVQGMSVCASGYLLVAISVDRCKSIYRPLLQPTGLHRSHAIHAVAFIWFVALFSPLPWAFTLTIVEEDGFTYCSELWDNALHGKIYFFCVNVFIFYMLPTVLITITNIMICAGISWRQVTQETGSASTNAYMLPRHTRNEVRKMLGLVTLCFLLSWLPLYVLVIRYRYFPMGITELGILDELLPFAQWLAISNSSVNPLIYAFVNGQYQRAFQSMLPCVHKLYPRARPPAARGNYQEGMELR